MSTTRFALTSLLLTISALQGCSKAPEASAPAAPTLPVAMAAVPIEMPQRKSVKACDLIPAGEMSAILGGAVSAKPYDRFSGKTQCIYKPSEGISPYVEFSIEWGSGAGAMAGAAMMGQREPGIASPYDGIGDQAVAVGPALMIKTGKDLVTIVFSGVEDTPAKAKKIFDAAKARM